MASLTPEAKEGVDMPVETYVQSRVKLILVAITAMLFMIWLEYLSFISDRHNSWANIIKILLPVFILWGFYGAYRIIKFPDTLELSAEQITYISKFSNFTQAYNWSEIVEIKKYNNIFGRTDHHGIRLKFSLPYTYNATSYLLPGLWELDRQDMIDRMNAFREKAHKDAA